MLVREPGADGGDDFVGGVERGLCSDLLASGNIAVPRPGISGGGGAFLSGFHRPER
jgi:hypothetical protein